ncbi:preprotein translocase subunit SecG [Sphingosinicella sp. LHD-64]|uniref:preprotein translocase subunit SecG n=1 Tax=Sphingosinicella sp. LHD-64 TaxID=3072139 RepID=UPI00280EB088|nr:preprotein translocase subunit SecG [Sphingosinicella sp. LHD-64]MDQ8757968.1 preprotein translocase subunit SecG [Sphingosinicella sp. LHD-64]
MFTFLLIIQTLVAIGMITVILMQRSEGGGLAGGGSPSGLMTARGAADFLTRTTSILATIFVVLSIVIAALAANRGGPRTIDPNLARQAPAAPTAPAGQAPDPFALPGAVPKAGTVPAPATAAPEANQAGGVPLAQ